MERYDVIIVGSGPAGTSTALNIRALAPEISDRTLVLEKASHPRERVCAGAVRAGAVSTLERLGIKLSIPFRQVNRIRIRYGADILDLCENDIGRVVRRSEFDTHLAGEAQRGGVELHENEVLTGMERKDGGMIVSTALGTYWSRVVVGADGTPSRVRKLAGIRDRMVAATNYMVEVPAEMISPDYYGESADMLTFDFSLTQRCLSGYIWEFPCIIDGRDYVSIGLFNNNLFNTGPPSYRRNLRQILMKQLKSRGLNPDDCSVKSHPTRMFQKSNIVSAPGVLLVGDAAGVDSFAGEGIYHAIKYGQLAAHEVVRAFRTGDLSFSHYIRSILNSDFGGEIVRFGRVARALYGSSIKFNFILSLLWNSPDIQRMMIQNYKGTYKIRGHVMKVGWKMAHHLIFGDKGVPIRGPIGKVHG